MKHQNISSELKNKFFHNKCTREEHKQVLQWMKTASSKELSEFMGEQTQMLQSNGIEENTHTDIAFEQIENKIQFISMTKTRRITLRFVAGVAASFIILVACYYSYSTFKNVNEEQIFVQPEAQLIESLTEYGKQSNLKLSDGSIVKLNAGTKLVYPEKFIGNKRELKLHGQAFFDVARNENAPFIINTTDMQITVLGTSFDIKSFDEDNISKVTVLSGTVKVVLTGQNDSIVLSANDQLVYDAVQKAYKTRVVDAKETIAWINGVLKFDDSPLTDVFSQMQRWYNVEINFSKGVDLNCTVSGRHKNEGLKTVLEALQFSLGLQFEYDNDTVLITKINCD